MHNCPYDVIGVGFGPAAIALATTIEDWVEATCIERPESIRFLEKASTTTWHGGLLLPGTIINHHYLRDLATPRNPRSRFTFPNYLKEVGRLFDLGHLDGKVGRSEWASYITWVANQLSDYVTYNEQVIRVLPVTEGQTVQYLRIITKGNSYLTRHLVIATGAKPRIPPLYQPYLGNTCFHTSEFLEKISLLDKNNRLRVLVVGSGQSGAESVLYLRNTFQRSRIYSLHRGVGFRLKDTGHFSNAIYYPEETDYFYNLSPETRHLALREMFPADYGNVDYTVSAALFAQMYEDKLRGDERIVMLNRKEVAQIFREEGRYQVHLTDIYTRQSSIVDVDVLVVATGYYEESCSSLLEDVKPYIQNEASRQIKVRRNYEIATTDHFMPSMFFCGMSERTHGISDTQSWSMMALKADLIFRSLLPSIEEAVSIRSQHAVISRIA